MRPAFGSGASAEGEVNNVHKTRLAIELAPDRLEVARLRGRGIIGATRRRLDPEQWETVWREGLQPLDEALAESLKTLGVKDAQADVYHHGPEASAEISSHLLPPHAARQATLLAMADHLGVGLADQPHDVRIVAQGRLANGKHQTHVLFTGDSEHSAETLAAWLGRASMTPGRLTPSQSCHMAATVAHAITHKDEPTVVLRMGEDKSVIAVVSEGKIRLARNLGLGIARLTQALCRPISTASGEVTLDYEEARGLLFEHGIPERGDTISAHKLSATDMLPAVQPVLQRCLIELRQSLRFGLSNDEERASARIVVLGPGAAIPRLAQVLGAELSLHAEVFGAEGFGHQEPGCKGSDLIDAIGAPMHVNLLPRDIAQVRSLIRLRAAVVTGAAAALLIGGGQTMLASSRAAELRSQARAFSSQVVQVQQLEAQRDEAKARGQALTALHMAVEDSLGPTPGIAGFLRDLPTLLPRNVRLLDLRIARDDTGAAIEIVACALAPSARSASASPTKQIATLVEQFGSSALVDRVELGDTQATTIDDRNAMQFTLNVHLLGVPASLLAMGEVSPEVSP